jgi:hypothetical protein
VVCSCVDIQYIQPLLQQLDRGQYPVAMQAVWIQGIGSIVRGHDERNSVVEQCLEQVVENHRIRNIRHMEFVEADQSIFFGDAASDLVERVCNTLQFVELPVHAAHEFMEVQPGFTYDRHDRVKAVHQEGLAAPDTTPHIDPARHLRPIDQAPELA